VKSSEIRKKFKKFFEKKGHKFVPSSSLIPSDETVLLNSAGMQQFVKYFTGEKDVLKDFGNMHLISMQKCFRTGDIEEVGDDTHHTFFEMFGNWSIGVDEKNEYFKQGAIKLALEFFIEEMGLDKEKFYVTIFKGEDGIPRDDESFKIWQKNGISKERIREFGAKDNFWGPTALTGPCGPCSEIHYDRGEKFGCGDKNCGPNCEKCKRFVELWNLVFMEYYKNADGSYKKLPQTNVDTGIGFERLTAILQNKSSAYEADLFYPVIQKLEKISYRNYTDFQKEFRIIADHLRGSIFLIADGIEPSNIARGYILRRILRRIIGIAFRFNFPEDWYSELIKIFQDIYEEFYKEIITAKIEETINQEEIKFLKTIESGMKEFERVAEKQKTISAEKSFYLYQTFGFPVDFMKDLCAEKRIGFDERGFKEEFKKHQEISRAGAEKKFGGLGKTADYKAIKLHTATHLLHQSLRQVLGNSVKQMGSDVTSERLRFDFVFPRKITKEEIRMTEDLVNEKIKDRLRVEKKETFYQEAIDSGALGFFKDKYPERVNVYTIGDFSKEICAGPHVSNTAELGNFKIIKEESSSAGVRRIKATLK